MNKPVHKYIAASVILLLLSILPYPLRAEDADKVILPETPPTIEYYRKTTLDKPVLRRQNFVTDPEINSLPEVSVAEFKNLNGEPNPIYAGLGCGSFGTVFGSFLYSSSDTCRIGCKSYYTDGEIEQLKKRDNAFDWSLEKSAGENFLVRGNILADIKTIWTQDKNFYGIGAGFGWYPGQNINIKLNAASGLTELKGFDDNHSLSGDLTFNWQTFTDNMLSLYASGTNYSALNNYDNFETYKGRYAVMPFSAIVIGAGGAIYKDKAYPEADFTWHMFGRLRLNVLYDPGIDQKSFSGMFFDEYYESPDNDILFPEKTFSMKEKLECFFTETSSCAVEVSQANYKNYIYRAQVPASAFVSWYNYGAADKYVSRCTLSYRDIFNNVTKSLSVSYNSDKDMPFVPEYNLDASVAYAVKKWNAALDYNYIATMYFALGNASQLPAAGDLSFSVGRNFACGLETLLKFENLLSEKIETQPGFLRKSPTIELDLKLKF